MTSQSATEQTREESQQSTVLDELVYRPLADIALELRRLREENARLKDERQRFDALLPEGSDISWNRLGYGSVRSTLFVVSSTTHRTPANLGKLPFEVLLPILRASRAPHHQLDPSVRQGANSAWLAEQRCRKGLLSVCRGWAGAARELFYEDIVLRRMGQILALAAELESHKHLARMVKSIRLDTCVILPACADAALYALRSIFALCTTLRRFEYHTAEHFPTAVSLPVVGDSYGAFNPAWFVEDGGFDAFRAAFGERLSTLTVLDLAMPLSHKRVAHLHARLLPAVVCLGTLKLGLVQKAVEGDKDHLGSLPVLHLPQLTELSIPADEAVFVAHVYNTWEMPALTRLATRNTPLEYYFFSTVTPAALHLLCEKYSVKPDDGLEHPGWPAPAAYEDSEADDSGSYVHTDSEGSTTELSRGWDPSTPEDTKKEGDGEADDADDDSEGTSERESDCWQPGDEPLDRNAVLDMLRSSRDNIY